jgi:hypothetical protein
VHRGAKGGDLGRADVEAKAVAGAKAGGGEEKVAAVPGETAVLALASLVAAGGAVLVVVKGKGAAATVPLVAKDVGDVAPFRPARNRDATLAPHRQRRRPGRCIRR